MHKILISIGLAASLTGCSNIQIDKDSWDLFGDVLVNSLNELPIIYRPVVVQGNIITQELVDELSPGMTRKQVEFVLGTSLLRDVFHDDRWDYYYGIGIGSIELEKRLTLEFEENRLVRIVGDYYPQPAKEGEGKMEDPDKIIDVPDWQPTSKSIIEQAMETIGIDDPLD